MSGSVSTEWTVPGTGVSVRNRTVLAAMTNKQSEEDGTLSDDEINWLLRRAEGGFGIVTTAASHVHPSGKSWEGEMGVWGGHHIPRLKGCPLCDDIGLIKVCLLYTSDAADE